MIFVSAARAHGFGKSYETLAYSDIEAFRQAMLSAGSRCFHLVRVDPWEGSWDYIRSNIPVEDLTQEHLDWVDDDAGGNRYLACRV